jgi:hypothetical protein
VLRTKHRTRAFAYCPAAPGGTRGVAAQLVLALANNSLEVSWCPLTLVR